MAINVACAMCGNIFKTFPCRIKRGRDKYCSFGCASTGAMKKRVPDREQFMANFIPEPNTGCWLWTGNVGKRGYGVVSRGSHCSRITAHRLSWELFNGSIPEEMNVCHKCDTPLCVNPRHLFLGTHQDNHLDKLNKGRASGGSRPGELNNLSKLTVEQVAAIRSDSRSQSEIATSYGVTQTAISAIKTRKTWRHV